jgi:hypothetical protein
MANGFAVGAKVRLWLRVEGVATVTEGVTATQTYENLS